MSTVPTVPITDLLHASSAGDRCAHEALIAAVYDELHSLARSHLRREPDRNVLQTTTLVHEAYVRLCHQQRVRWQSRRHFYSIASHLMRRVLLDQARRRTSLKRGGRTVILRLEDLHVEADTPPDTLLALDDALRDLDAVDPELTRIVGMRFYAGMSNQEAASALGISVSTVTRRVRLARAWLLEHLTPNNDKTHGKRVPETTNRKRR